LLLAVGVRVLLLVTGGVRRPLGQPAEPDRESADQRQPQDPPGRLRGSLQHGSILRSGGHVLADHLPPLALSFASRSLRRASRSAAFLRARSSLSISFWVTATCSSASFWLAPGIRR